jgi:uracil-DNA glycosylase
MPDNVTRIPLDWREQLDPIVDWAQFEATQALVQKDRDDHVGRVYPPASEVFRAFEVTRFHSVRAVILGQDPYPRAGQADGLAFSLRPGASPFPSSLRNILDEVERDYGPVNRNGSLVPWAEAGVLLLNAALTVIDGRPGVHLKAWTPFTDDVIKAVALRASPVVFMLWGRRAKAKRTLVDNGRHLVQVRSHPSGRSAYRNFKGTSPFRSANGALTAAGLPEIDWSLPLG